MASLAALLAALAAPCAKAEDTGSSPPAATSVSKPPDIDAAPTGAVAPTPAEASISRLDVPQGIAPDLPPDVPPPSFTRDPAEPAAAPTAAEALAAEIHAAVEKNLAAAKPAGRPIGAGDWSAARKAVAAVYAERAYAPLWLEATHFSAHARAAMARLARAPEDGLDLAAAPPPSADIAEASPTALAQADIALSTAVVAYAMQASGARINPRSLSKDVSAKPEVADPGFALKRVAAADDPDAALLGFNPPQAGYRALRDALAALRGEAAPPVARLGPGPVLKLGMSDPRVPLIRARFGLGSVADAPTSEVYDIRVASAVAAFQRVHGLKASGALTEATASALEGANLHQARERLLIANMEMWRWLPREMGEVRVEVNVPDFSLKLMNGDAIVHKARVIVGKPDTPTPIFSNSIKYMLFNPAWHVPDSIIKKEMAPKFAADPSYFERHGYKVTYVGKQMVVEQPPGEANALGRMLFLFPNEHAVYLHDTPMRSLFSASYRALSHGCVRVEDPARLAEILMGGAARGWTERRVQSLLGDKERTFSLPAPVPVHLEYFTLVADEGGTLRERPDLYGLTGKVAALLAPVSARLN